jgi:hypothetical protein
MGFGRGWSVAPSRTPDAVADTGALSRHLVSSGLAGEVATTVENCLDNVERLLAGRAGYTFGLSDWKDATFDEVVAAMRAAGGRPDGPAGADGGAFIDPDAAVAAIAHHRAVLDRLRAAGSGRVLVATGHPFALLPHYGAVSRALTAAGITVLRPLEGAGPVLTTAGGRPCSLRYLDGVACVFQAVALHHTHHPHYMEAMLDEVGGPAGVDLVVADHGFAGAAIEAGIPTLAIADVNDLALPLAQGRGRTEGVVVLDDGLDASRFVPVTDAVVGPTAG